MPHSLEFPRVRRAVVPLVRAGDSFIYELVAHRLPSFATVVGALHDLSGPAARLRRVNPIRISGRSLEVVHLPAGKVWAANIPLLAFAVSRQDERTLLRPHQNSNAAHLPLLRVVSGNARDQPSICGIIIFPYLSGDPESRGCCLQFSLDGYF